MSDVEVGDWVTSKVTEDGIKEGNQYFVELIDKDKTVYFLDDENNGNCLLKGQYTPVTTSHPDPDPDTYTRILEEMLGEEQVKIVKRIFEAMK